MNIDVHYLSPTLPNPKKKKKSCACERECCLYAFPDETLKHVWNHLYWQQMKRGQRSDPAVCHAAKWVIPCLQGSPSFSNSFVLIICHLPLSPSGGVLRVGFTPKLSLTCFPVPLLLFSFAFRGICTRFTVAFSLLIGQEASLHFTMTPALAVAPLQAALIACPRSHSLHAAPLMF